MELDQILGLILLGWLIASMVLVLLLIRKGQRLVAYFEAQHPETYEALDRPRPGLWYSARRSRFAQFVSRREYEELQDPKLSRMFEAYRKTEIRILLIIIVSLAVVGSVVLTLRLISGSWGN